MGPISNDDLTDFCVHVELGNAVSEHLADDCIIDFIVVSGLRTEIRRQSCNYCDDQQTAIWRVQLHQLLKISSPPLLFFYRNE